MADNYLENKFEQYRSGKLAPKKVKVFASSRPGSVTVKYPPLRVFVTSTCQYGKAIVEAFRKMQCRVVFCGEDRQQGTAFAQTSGARFCPITEHSLLSDYFASTIVEWGGIDVLIDLTGHFALGSLSCRRIVVSSEEVELGKNDNEILINSESSSNAVAATAVFLASPDAAPITCQRIRV